MNKNLPIFIIIIVLIAAVVGGIALFRNPGGPPPPNKNGDTNRAVKQAEDFARRLAAAPQGASPAWSQGDPAARITLEEFADFSCPQCAAFHQRLKEIKKSYGPRLRITYRHFPLSQIKGHENSYDAARAAEAAGTQGQFWEMQNMLFTNQKTWTVMPENEARNTFAEYAKSLGIDVEKFKEDLLNNQAVNARVAADMNRGKGINIGGTPTVILNGRLLADNEIMNVTDLRQAIENEMQKVQPAPAASNSNQNAQ